MINDDIIDNNAIKTDDTTENIDDLNDYNLFFTQEDEEKQEEDFSLNIIENNNIENDNMEDNNSIELKKHKIDLCADITPDNIPSSLDEIELQIDRLKQRWGEFTYLIGQRLAHISEKKLFREKGYSDFKTYVNIALKMSENNAYYYISVYDYFTQEQTSLAGSKLKLIIPILNKIKRDKSIPDDIKTTRINDLRNELFTKIYNKTYREAEKLIKELKLKYFTDINTIENFERIIVRGNKIIITEDDETIRDELIKIIDDFYLS